MPAIERTKKGADEDCMERLSPKEKSLYNIVQGYFRNMGAVESLPTIQRNQIYSNLAKIYNNLAAQFKAKPEYKQEAMLLKVMALAYARNAMKYGQPGYGKNSANRANTGYNPQIQAGKSPEYSKGNEGNGAAKSYESCKGC